MGLRQFLREQKLIQSGVVNMEFVMEGEPLPFSVNTQQYNRRLTMHYFNAKKWRSMLKCFFRAYMKNTSAVVLIVAFYVTPPEGVKITPRRLKKEIVPAIKTYEICDYLLAFLQVLFQVLFSTYRQIVKIDAEKFYSKNPRTVFKFMSWEHYVILQDKNFSHTKSKSFRKDAKEQVVQSKRKRHGAHNKRNKGTATTRVPAIARPADDDRALSAANA